MQPSGEIRINPLKEQALFMDALRKVIFRIAPYRGVVSVKFLDRKSATANGALRYTSAHAPVPKGYSPKFPSIDEAGAGEALLSLLVSFYQDLLDYDHDIVVVLHEAADRNPLCGTFGKHNLYVEFGAVGATDYLPY